MIITGASTGVGKAAALRFAQEGYDVCALARSTDKLRELEERTSGAVRAYPADVSDAAAVKNAFAAIRERFRRLDVLVNNAGVTSGGRPADAAMVDRIIDTNLKGAMYCTFEALPMLRDGGGGHIFNVASIAGVDIAPNGNDGLYAASKHGMVAFSESIGKMVRRDGVLVTALCPGGIDTPLWGEENPYPFDKEAMIRPEEVADLIAYILAQPKRTLFKNVIFVPVVEQW
jgi:NAD(P)-dependent dehydrogenase (short-subunit alcohol dehydrogenase family)